MGATAPYTASGFSNNKVLNGLQMAESTGVSHYDSMQAALKRQFRSLQFLLSYTFSRSIDEGSGAPTNELAALPGDQQDRRPQRGLSDFDRTHRLVVSFDENRNEGLSVDVCDPLSASLVVYPTPGP